MIQIQQKDFQSNEEYEFYHWLLEAELHGLVSEIEYQPCTFVLSDPIQYTKEEHLKTRIKYVKRHLLAKCEYTPDFRFMVHNSSIQSLLKNTHTIAYNKTIVDVKGGFAGKRNSSAVTFPIKQKWLYKQEGIYVEKVVPEKLFKKTWVPEMARLSPKKKQPVKKYLGCKTINDFMKGE